MAVDEAGDAAVDSDPSEVDGDVADISPPLTPSLEDALRHIYHIETTGDGWVKNSALTDHLGVTKATVTNTFEVLADRGLIERQKYRPVRLTERGRLAALHVIRRHRLAEAALYDLLDFDLGALDAEADVLEHHLSDRLCAAIERRLGMPLTDPHGDPIPDAALTIPETVEFESLATISVATTDELVVTRLRARDDAVVEYLVGAGVEPGSKLVVDERTSFGMVIVTVDAADETVSLPEHVASGVLVRPVGGK